MTYETIKKSQQLVKNPQQSTNAWNLSKSVASKTISLTRKAPLDEIPAKRRKPAPDFDVVYTKNYPTGSTERSKRLLQKAASMESKKTSSPQSVFDRLGQTLTNKNVKFASGTKECSPEVSSTTKDDFPTLECDKMIRKMSALGRLGPKTGTVATTAKGTAFDSDSLTVTVVGGQRKLLTANRSFSSPKLTNPVTRTIPRSATTMSKAAIGGCGVKSRLGHRHQSNIHIDQLDEEDDEKSDVFSRLGKRKSF